MPRRQKSVGDIRLLIFELIGLGKAAALHCTHLICLLLQQLCRGNRLHNTGAGAGCLTCICIKMQYAMFTIYTTYETFCQSASLYFIPNPILKTVAYGVRMGVREEENKRKFSENWSGLTIEPGYGKVNLRIHT